MLRCRRWIRISLGLCLAVFPLRATTAPDPAAVEMVQCGKNLHIIYQAIQAYRRAHQDLPRELADLIPQFLADNQYLICPAARRLGLTSADLTEWGSSGPSTYGYEFAARAIPGVISGGSKRQMKEWKELQLGLIGSDVPMVRCHTHEQAILNLSFGGRITASANLDWEQDVKDVIDPSELSARHCLAAYLVQKVIVVPRRSATAPPTLVDLSPTYTSTLTESWPADSTLYPLLGLAPGINEFNGTQYDLRGAVQLRALTPGLIQYEDRVDGIQIGSAGPAVHLLVGSVHAVSRETTVAQFEFHLRNGRLERFPLRYGMNVSACVRPESSLPGSDLKVAWSSKLKAGQVVSLYECCWRNPFPREVIESVDFVGRDSEAGPILFALSVESAR